MRDFLFLLSDTRLALALALSLVLSPALAPALAEAQWISDSTTNTAVCVAPGVQDHPAACSDGANGAIIAWQDTRNGSSTIYAQRLDKDGHEVWAHNGVLLCSDMTASQAAPVIASDVGGGAYVVWVRGGTKLYAQHVQGDGSLAYSSSGLQIAAGGADIVMCSDGQGGAFVSWDYSTNLYLNRLTSGGSRFGASGIVVDGSKSYQRYPAICPDGTGGCFLAWQSGATIPYSIYANRFDANGTAQWNTPGILVFKSVCGVCTAANAGHVAVGLDGKQLMLAWEVTSGTSADTQNIMAARIRCSTVTDTTSVWGQGIDVTGEMLYNQTLPQIFSDDEAVGAGADFRGIMVPFQYQKPGSSDDWDVSMIRVLGDGSTTLPGSYSAYEFAPQPHGQTGFRAIKIDTGILAVWNDARFYGGSGPDTCIYGQLLDKYGKRRFPTYGTTSKWGKPICHGTWTAKQVTIAPRTNGAIVAWTDYRAGTNDPSIYAQLLFRDGSLPIELSSFEVTCRYRGQVDLAWKTASEQENAGFEIQRRRVSDANFTAIASYLHDNSLRGAGSSNEERVYAWTDRDVSPDVYEYRLVEVALDGTRLTHDAKQVDARIGTAIEGWSLGPNQPNPFADRTALTIGLPVDALVDLTICDVTGRTLTSPISHQLRSKGVCQVTIDQNVLGSASGELLARVIAYDPVTGGILWQSEKPVMMYRLR